MEFEAQDVAVILCGGSVAGVWRAESAKAILIDFYGHEEWIPKSLCTINPGNPVEIEVEDWLAEKIEAKLGEVG